MLYRHVEYYSMFDSPIFGKGRIFNIKSYNPYIKYNNIDALQLKMLMTSLITMLNDITIVHCSRESAKVWVGKKHANYNRVHRHSGNVRIRTQGSYIRMYDVNETFERRKKNRIFYQSFI